MDGSKQQPRISSDEIGVVRLAGDFDMAGAGQVRQTLFTALGENRYRIVVDMLEVRYLDSSGISTLIACLKLARENGGDLALCGLNERIRNVLRLTGLDQLFPLFPDESVATKYLAGR